MADTVTPDELEALLKGPHPPRLLDVRRAPDRASDPSLLPTAVWKDPEKTAVWGAELGEGDVVVYCVRGGSVSRSVRKKLESFNVNVKIVEGGFEAWKKAGKPTQGT
jgi:rhodanese-related sulfurtransferase